MLLSLMFNKHDNGPCLGGATLGATTSSSSIDQLSFGQHSSVKSTALCCQLCALAMQMLTILSVKRTSLSTRVCNPVLNGNGQGD